MYHADVSLNLAMFAHKAQETALQAQWREEVHVRGKQNCDA